MSRLKVRLMGQLLAVVFAGAFGVKAFAEGSCDESKNPDLCRSMRALRSHINLLDMDRDLLQANFGLVDATAESMYQLIVKVLVQREPSQHLEPLNIVLNSVRKLRKEAGDHNHQAFETANQLKGTCAVCHTSGVPNSAQPTWYEVFANSWDQVSGHCNQVGRNPLVCKYMHAMATEFDYFQTALKAEHLDLPLAEQVSRELKRQTSFLELLGGGGHEGGLALFREITKKAADLETKAQRQDPYVYQLSASVHEICSSCHELRN